MGASVDVVVEKKKTVRSAYDNIVMVVITTSYFVVADSRYARLVGGAGVKIVASGGQEFSPFYLSQSKSVNFRPPTSN